jgi:hypothetical protein
LSAQVNSRNTYAQQARQARQNIDSLNKTFTNGFSQSQHSIINNSNSNNGGTVFTLNENTSGAIVDYITNLDNPYGR